MGKIQWHHSTMMMNYPAFMFNLKYLSQMVTIAVGETFIIFDSLQKMETFMIMIMNIKTCFIAYWFWYIITISFSLPVVPFYSNKCRKHRKMTITQKVFFIVSLTIYHWKTSWTSKISQKTKTWCTRAHKMLSLSLDYCSYLYLHYDYYQFIIIAKYRLIPQATCMTYNTLFDLV